MSDLRTVHDQMGREVTFPFPPKRIISLVPSQTEFLIDIGAPVVGRTKFCIHPKDKIQDIPIIGGTKNFRFDQIKALKPDLIIGNKEENYEEGIYQLQADFPVWMSDIISLDDSFQMMKELGVLVDSQTPTQNILKECKVATDLVKGTKSGRALYFIWQKPWMAAGPETFIDHMLHHLGYENVIQSPRYPEITIEEIQALAPDYLFFSSEPYPFKEQHIQAAQALFPNCKCQLVDGEMYSWYGSRLRFWKGEA